MKRSTVAAVFAAILFAVSPAAAQVFADDDGRCAMGLLTAHTAHEWGHDFAAIVAGGSPWRPVAIWGDKWDESQKNFRAVAIGGFVGQHLFAAFSAATPDDSFSQCAVHGSAVLSAYSVLRARFTPEDSGDYDPFPTSKRRVITLVNIWASLFLEGFAESTAADEQWTRAHSSVFNFQKIFRGQ